MTTRGIILAAGRGSRMGKLTDDAPKCLVPLAGKPLLEWQKEAMAQSGVSPIGVVRGYKGERLESRADVLFDNPRWAETNMVRSLLCASSWLEEFPCVVSYADIAYGAEAVSALCRARAEIAITYDARWRSLWESRFSNPLADAETFRIDGRSYLSEIGGRPKSLDEIEGQYMGLLRFTPEGFSLVLDLLSTLPPAQVDSLQMTALLQMLLAHGIAIDAVQIDGGFCEVDSEQDLRLYEDLLQREPRWTHDFRRPGR
jgi:choline kinase